MPSISVVFPVYIPSEEHRKMTDKNLYHAKKKTSLECEWIIVETCSDFYINEADVYIHERKQTTPNISINRAFAACTGDYVAYLSNDVTVCDGWIEKMLKCFEEKEDCGIASLGNNEHNDPTEDRIAESFYFSTCLLKRSDAWYDPFYKRIFQDTDLAFNLHLQGKRFYKNLAGQVYHKPHATYGKFAGDLNDYETSREYFKKKYINHKEDDLYKIFAGIR